MTVLFRPTAYDDLPAPLTRDDMILTILRSYLEYPMGDIGGGKRRSRRHAFGRIVQDLLHQQGLTQRQACDLTGDVNYGVFNHRISGNKRWRLVILRKLLPLLGRTAEELLDAAVRVTRPPPSDQTT